MISNILIDLKSSWKTYTKSYPNGFKGIGCISISIDGVIRKGALMESAAGGSYYIVNGGTPSLLPCADIKDALTIARKGKSGGSGLGQGMRAKDNPGSLLRKQVKLDYETINHLQELGDGNLSLGIRRASKKLS